ncbi:hypothetical protein JOS77_06315 [Chromobacterium haemolyticum]|nr:hypothetical protein JOS77_06315 [Chromobacterium haemolyticum]
MRERATPSPRLATANTAIAEDQGKSIAWKPWFNSKAAAGAQASASSPGECSTRMEFIYGSFHSMGKGRNQTLHGCLRQAATQPTPFPQRHASF